MVRPKRLFPMLSVQSLDEAIKFYKGLLGGEEAFRFPPDGDAVFVTLRLGESELGIGQLTDGPTLHGQPQRPASGHRIELCLYVDDVDAAVARLRDAGAPILLEPSDQPWGERVAYTSDPDGNLVMLVR